MALLRQQNREAPFSEQSADDEFENLFDQYVTSDILDTENHLVESSFVGAECSALRMKATGGGIAAGSSRAVNTARRLDSQQTWHMAPWHQIAALPSNSQGGNFNFYKESSGRAAISDGELLSLEGRIPQIHTLIPSSSPPTPSPSHSTPSSIKRTEDLSVSSRNVCRDPVIRKKHRRNNSRESPTMNHMQYQQEPARSWHQHPSSSSAASNLQVPPTTMPCTPPPTAGRSGFPGVSAPKGESLNEGFEHNGRRISSQVQQSPTVIVQHPQRSGMPHRSISSNYSLERAYPSATQGFDSTIGPYHSSAPSVFSASPGFETSQTQPWVYPTHTVSASQPSQPAYQFPRVDPQHEASKSLIQYTGRDYDSQMLDGSASIANAGLMIHNASSASQEDQLMTGMTDSSSPAYYSAPAGDPMAIVSPDISSQGHSFDGLPAKQPHLSVSPSSPPSRSLSRSPGPRGHGRRPSKTSNRVRKYSGYSTGQQPRMPTNEQAPNSSRRKHSSGYSNGQQPRSPSGEILFENLTANDSQVILAGVAPSGSSKTKERREKEAREKQKQYNQQLFEMVCATRGDPEVLKRKLLSET
ncbi:hypothetical protein FGG08_004476 [Glutinoglossum americanum]|uniref:Developmental regulatory protein wetA n=1 Tax=Glutinoglossum americanum TaxID=1670608 RepID=A0A9P8I0I6_9PEZI|nr:hypothetical protein FGG08_004476 [Glutinoglossum americanum]